MVEATDGNLTRLSSSSTGFQAISYWFASSTPIVGLLASLLAFWIVPTSFAQSGTTEQINCADPVFAATSFCRGTDSTNQTPAQSQTGIPNTPGNAENQRNGESQLYVDSAGTEPRRNNTASRQQDFFPADPITDFQRLVRSSTGEDLPIFGRDLFQRAPSSFAPADQIPVTADYLIGPGDQILVRLWGPESFNSQLTVDTTGSIYIPKVGAIHVAGLRYDELQKQISTEVSHIYRNFNLSVNLGQLRSIQIYVVGEARRPGAYTISSLSTVLNALFLSGGPSVQGSLRRIQIRRGSQPPAEFDLYDLVLHGNKSKDLRLEQGDTVFIPAAGPQIALAGSVRHPAIYEILGATGIPEILQYAGGFTATATSDRISLERIDTDHTRKTVTIAMDAEGRTMALRDGDVLFVNHISPSYEKSVTIRGNLANPGRFPWHPGMRLSEIIPDRKSLLTNDYWRERNRLGVPVPLFEPLVQDRIMRPGASHDTFGTSGLPVNTDQDQVTNQSLRAGASALALQNSQLPSIGSSTQGGLFGETTQGSPSDSTTMAPSNSTAGTSGQGSSGQMAASASNIAVDPRSTRQQNKINIPTAEIDWSYAVIERLDPETLKSSLLPFNLGRLIQDHDAGQNLELQPGDVVTILSQADIPVPLDEQTKYVRLEGEFISAGVYSVRPNETLEDLVVRAGGLSSKAYLYGSNFLRESARIFQQQRLDEYISTLTADMERAAAVRAASSGSGILDPNALSQQRSLIAQLRQLRATGRVVLEFQPASSDIASIPKIPLENGDVFRVPSRPNTVSVIGAVYGQNVFLYNSERRVEDYISLAGKPNRVADKSHAFIIRADGSIYSRERAQGIWTNRFNAARINPGDAIVVPEKLVKPTALRQLLDYSQILSSFGLAAAAINVIR